MFRRRKSEIVTCCIAGGVIGRRSRIASASATAVYNPVKLIIIVVFITAERVGRRLKVTVGSPRDRRFRGCEWKT